MGFVRANTREGRAVVFIAQAARGDGSRGPYRRRSDGKVVGDLLRSETDEIELSKLMVGKEDHERTYVEDVVPEAQPVGLELAQRQHPGPQGEPLSHQEHQPGGAQGEVLGIAGVSGNGQDYLCGAISGYRRATEGEVLLNGQDITGTTVRGEIRMGIGYVPSDRHRYGMVMPMRLTENMLLKSSFEDRWVRHGLIDQRKLGAYTGEKVPSTTSRPRSRRESCAASRGGNQQKVILAQRWTWEAR